jgi:hypothetical protein
MDKTTGGMKVRAGIKAGGVNAQHNRGGLRVRAAVRAGGTRTQHNRAYLHIAR